MIRAAALALAALLPAAPPAAAQDVADMTPRDGWAVLRADEGFDALVEAVRAAAPGAGLAVVTMAGPTAAAARRGVDIPGNRVIGVFSNAHAVRLLRLSTPAMIEAPLRLYVTENADGTATLSYVRPTERLAPYAADSADPAAFAALAVELDEALAAIAAAATR